MLADGGSLAALWEINGGWGVGVSWTGPGVITLIDTSPHTHAHGPQGPIRGLGLHRREDGRLAQVLPASVSGV